MGRLSFTSHTHVHTHTYTHTHIDSNVATNNQDQPPIDENQNHQLFDKLKEKFTTFYTKFIQISVPVEEQQYSTKLSNNVSGQLLQEMNNVMIEFLKDKGQLSFWEINVMHYSTAITILDHNDAL